MWQKSCVVAHATETTDIRCKTIAQWNFKYEGSEHNVCVNQFYRRLLISENHLELLKNFPANFRFIVFQHSIDGYIDIIVMQALSSVFLSLWYCYSSQLFTAYLIPPQDPLPVLKKGHLLQQPGYFIPLHKLLMITVYHNFRVLRTYYCTSWSLTEWF